MANKPRRPWGGEIPPDTELDRAPAHWRAWWTCKNAEADKPGTWVRHERPEPKETKR